MVIASGGLLWSKIIIAVDGNLYIVGEMALGMDRMDGLIQYCDKMCNFVQLSTAVLVLGRNVGKIL